MFEVSTSAGELAGSEVDEPRKFGYDEGFDVLSEETVTSEGDFENRGERGGDFGVEGNSRKLAPEEEAGVFGVPNCRSRFGEKGLSFLSSGSSEIHDTSGEPKRGGISTSKVSSFEFTSVPCPTSLSSLFGVSETGIFDIDGEGSG